MSSELAPPHMSGIAHMGPAGVLGGMMAAGMVRKIRPLALA